MPPTPAPAASGRPPARAAAHELVIRPPSWSNASISAWLAALAEHRDLLYTLAVHRVRVRYKQSLLGPLWAILQPLATLLVLSVVFAYVARVETSDTPYALVAMAGLVPWTCFAGALGSATSSIVSHAYLVTRVYFPREILPVTYVLAAIVDSAVATVLLVAFMLALGHQPGPAWWWSIAFMALLAAFVTGLSLAAAAAQARARDVALALPVILQLLLFASPVAYPLDTVPAAVRQLYILNPLVGIVENFRRAVLGTGPIAWDALGVTVAWTLVCLPVGYVWFKRVDATVADTV